MAPLSLLLLIVVPLFAAAAAALSNAGGTTAYDVLLSNGLPMGLLPKGVKGFVMDDAGNFEVTLGTPCTARFENDVRYEANVSGTISYGQIGALKGLSAQELFLWFPVKGIRIDVPSSGLIYFDVGVIYKQFSLSLFETPPECRATDFEDAVDGRDGKGQDLDGRDIAGVISESKSGKLLHDKLNNDRVQNAVI